METEDQVQDDTLEQEKPEEEQDVVEQSEETPEPEVEQEQVQVDPEQRINALQKGYTQSRQELADLKRELETLKAQETPPAETEAEAPQTYEEMKKDLVSSLKDELTAPERERQKIEEESQQIVDQDLENLFIAGKIKSEEEEKEFINWAVKKHEQINESLPPEQRLSLRPVAMYPLYEEYKNAQKVGEENKAKKEVQQEAGSKVGKSSKATEEKGNVTPYEVIHNTDIQNL
jgi:hypothetical protein